MLGDRGALEDESSDPATITRPYFAAGGIGRPSVLVNPNSGDNGTAKTIQEGIDMVASGGQVLVVPGTYNEAIVIDKGLTLEGIGSENGPVIVAPAPGPDVAIEIATTGAVVIRNLTLHHGGFVGVRGLGPVDVTVELATISGPSRGGVVVINEAPTGRARLAVRNSRIEGPTTDPRISTQGGITARGDVDAAIERNVIRGSGVTCITVLIRSDLGGETNGEVVDNDLDACGEAGGVRIGSPVGAPTRPVTATGVVNIVGNRIRNSPGSCASRTGINWEVLGGRAERNSISGYVQACAGPGPRALPGAIWTGSRVGYPQTRPIIRFNDVVGNAQAGLRIGPNMSNTVDASCNYWGSPDGPSGVGPGSGDAIVVETGGTAPGFMPFARAPIAETGATSC